MRRPQLNFLLIGGLIAALLAGIGLSHLVQNQSNPEFSGLLLEQARALPSIALTDQNGQPYTNASYPDQWQLLFFGFTNCPDVCPNTLAVMKSLRKQLPEAVSKQIKFVFVSLDPARDTPAVLREYLNFFDPEFVGVTGDKEQIDLFTDRAGIAYLINDADADGSYNVDHSTALVLLQPGALVKAYFPAPHSLEGLSRSLQSVIQP